MMNTPLETIITQNDISNRLLNNIFNSLNRFTSKKGLKNEQEFIQSLVIEAGSYYESIPVDTNSFELARIKVFCSFNSGASAGISIDLYYEGSKIGELMHLSNSIDSIGSVSEPFDISCWNGFNFVIRNKDVSHSVKINNMKLVLYNLL